MTRLLLAMLAAAMLAPPSAAQTPQSGPGADLGRLAPGPEHDPAAAVTPEQRRRIAIFDGDRRAADPGASHIPTITGPATAPAPAIAVVPPAQIAFDRVPDRNLARELARPGPAVARRPTPQPLPGTAAALAAILGARPEPLTARAYATPPPPAADPRPASQAAIHPPLIAAGAAVYAVLDVAVDSRHAAPVIATLLAGPLKGARVIGDFRADGDAMLLRFDRLVTDSGGIHATEAYAVDPDCACYGIAGDVDRHWFARVVLPAAAAFAGGVLRAAARPQTRIVINGAAVTTTGSDADWRRQLAEGSADALAQAAPVLAETAPQRATVSVAAGTGLLVLFTQPAPAAGKRP